MKSHPTNTLQWIDSLKGLAISGIVLYHFFNLLSTGILHKLAKIGSQGIHIFFILSGFGLTLSCLSHNDLRWQEWFYCRFKNVLVPYYWAIAFVVLTTCLILPVRPHSLLASLFLYRNFFLDEILAINSAWWFVPTIFEFYIVFPLLFRMRRWPYFLPAAFILNTLFAIGYASLAGELIPLYSRFFLSFIFEFAFGMVLAEVYWRDPAVFKRRFTGWPMILGGGALAIGLFLSFCNKPVVSELNNMFNAAGIFILSYNLAEAYSFGGILNFLGRTSLAVFLLHETYIQVLYRYFGNHSSVGTLFVILIVYLTGLLAVARFFQRLVKHA